MVVFEDTAGLAGEVIAAAGVLLNIKCWRQGDGVASVLIGCLLGAMAIFLISQTRDLVVGEAVEDEIARSIRELAKRDEKFLAVRGAHTIHFGPETVLVAMETFFDPERPAGELIKAVDQIQTTIRERHPAVKYIYIDPESEEDHFRHSRAS